MKEIRKKISYVLCSWGVMLLIIALWIGGKFPETQGELLKIVRLYIGLVVVDVIVSVVLQVIERKRKNEHS